MNEDFIENVSKLTAENANIKEAQNFRKFITKSCDIHVNYMSCLLCDNAPRHSFWTLTLLPASRCPPCGLDSDGPSSGSAATKDVAPRDRATKESSRTKEAVAISA